MHREVFATYCELGLRERQNLVLFFSHRLQDKLTPHMCSVWGVDLSCNLSFFVGAAKVLPSTSLLCCVSLARLYNQLRFIEDVLAIKI